ncbi:MAG: hypothetical protein RBR53_01145 [Desulforegulaceae bacterium]|nr:hypothetical protein [Desulforegulaceae bacterium]
MKKTIATLIIFSVFIFPCFSKEILHQDDLKKIRGQAGIAIELEEIIVKVKYGTIIYTDTDGYGSIKKAGIKIISDDQGSRLYFKPVTDFGKYSNAKLKKDFGEQIGNLSLNKNLIKNYNSEINKIHREENKKSTKEKGVNFSPLIIETTDFCPLLTAMGVINSGLKEISRILPVEPNLIKGGIISKLPSIEATTGHSTKSIVFFTGSDFEAMNSNQTLLTIEKGPATQVIFGGTVEVSPNK